MKAGWLCGFGLLGSFLLFAQNKAESGSLPKEILAAHNAWRSQVGVPGLKWSQELADRAQQWADTLIQRGEYAPRRDGQFGENLFEINGGHASAEQVVAAWVSEEANFDAATNTCKSGRRCGHYTQVVWRTTKRVGCGVAQAGRREVWVCNYDPHGNIVGERPY